MSDQVLNRAMDLYYEKAERLGIFNSGQLVMPWFDLPLKVQEDWLDVARKEKGEAQTGPVPVSPLASDILNQARAIVSGDRQTMNGKPERSFAQLAQMWSAYLGVPVTDVDCAQMLALLKMVRAKSGVTKGDHFVDQAGYSALAGELAANGAP